MSDGEQGLTDVWREIDALLMQARTIRPLHRSATLLDLDRLAGCADVPLLERLARAIVDWEGHLILTATDDGLAPDIRTDDRLVIDPAAESRDGDVVVAFTGGVLLTRRLRVRDRQIWLESAVSAPLRLGPLVAVLGGVIELRRALRP